MLAYCALTNSVQEHKFIQTVTLSKGKSPVIIAYLSDQLKDMKRFSRNATPSSM